MQFCQTKKQHYVGRKVVQATLSTLWFGGDYISWILVLFRLLTTKSTSVFPSYQKSFFLIDLTFFLYCQTHHNDEEA